ncbi:hypothetical protein Vafri_18038, partial [Volvox africanus]
MGEGGKRKARHEDVPEPPSHCILTADELGLLKVTEIPSGNKWEEAAAKQRWGHPDKQQGITRLQVHSPEWDPDSILVAAARGGGRVTLHVPARAVAEGASVSRAVGAVEVGSFRAAPPAITSGRSDTSSLELRGLRVVVGGEGSYKLRLVTCTVGGHVAVHGYDQQEEGGRPVRQGDGGGGQDDDDDENGATCGGGGEGGASGVVRTWEEEQQRAAAAAAGGFFGRGRWREVVRMQTLSNVQDMDVSSSGRHVAVGGDGHQLRVWDLTAAASASSSAAPEPIFAGKGGKPSRSGLHDLAHVTAVSYVPGRDDQLVLVGTAKHKLWLYDMRAGRKPQSEVVWGEGRITVLLPQPDGSRVWAGNGRGQVEALDMRQAPSRVSMGHALKGSAGSIRSLSLHPSQPLIASVSLDRHLRVHSTTNRQLLTKVYLKQALTGVAWLPTPQKPNVARGKEEIDEHEDEDGGRRADDRTNGGVEAENGEGEVAGNRSERQPVAPRSEEKKKKKKKKKAWKAESEKGRE